MTRENKLALVVGFGLLLLVGILVSDHFSTSRAPLVERFGGEDPGLFEPGSLEPLTNMVRVDRADTAANERTDDSPASTQYRPLDSVGGRSPERADDRRTGGSGGGAIIFQTPDERSGDSAGATRRDDNPADVGRHQVARGESLSAIADRYYGTPTLWRALATYNEIDDPDRVPVGHSLRIPARAVLDGTAAKVRTAPPSVREPDVEMYTVRESETLSDLARRFLGSGNKWRDLYRMNEDRIDDPDRLLPGTRIRVPRQSS